MPFGMFMLLPTATAVDMVMVGSWVAGSCCCCCCCCQAFKTLLLQGSCANGSETLPPVDAGAVKDATTVASLLLLTPAAVLLLPLLRAAQLLGSAAVGAA
jgi:hypothetical protein